MKKVLLATSALIAFGAVSAQAAEPVKLSIGGYMVENVGYADNKSNQNKTAFDVQSDVNINFVGSTKLDNGISVGVEVDTFGSQRQDSRNVSANNTAGNSNTKRSFMTVSGNFGALIVGEREDALYIVHNAAPDVGAVGLQDGSWFQWVTNPSSHRLYSATNTSRYDDRTQKISYVTPAFYGLAAAASYVPDASLSGSGHTSMPTSTPSVVTLPNGAVNGTDVHSSVWGAGLAYANTFGDVSVKADAGAAQASLVNLRLYQAGLQVGYAGFTFGGSYFNRNVDSKVNSTYTTAVYAGQSWDAGVAYKTGPYAVSLGYFHDTSKDDVLGTSNGGGADSTAVWALGGAYTMGPGVTWKSSIAHVDYQDGRGSSAAGDSNQGWAAVTGLRVDF